MRRFKLFITAAFVLVAPGMAQNRFDAVEIKVERVAPGVAVLFGSGGNIGLSHGEDGNILIDDQFAPLTAKILAAVKTVDPDPIAFVINTHWHGDHSGGNENLGKAGAVIVAHDNVRRRMSVDTLSKRFGSTIKASPKAALPVVTFAQGVSVHLNGDDIRVIHVANAHTDGDSLVWFEQSRVLHMGDTFFHKVTLPFIDLESGGSIDGLIVAVKAALAMLPDDAKVIPGHGPMATKADLAAYLAMLEDVRGKVAAARASGKTVEAVRAMKIADRYAVPNAFIGADDFVATVYQSLAAGTR